MYSADVILKFRGWLEAEIEAEDEFWQPTPMEKRRLKPDAPQEARNAFKKYCTDMAWAERNHAQL